MTRRSGLPIAALLFTIAATANAGGYRFGVSDQAFYIPAIELTLDPSRFPHDRALFEPQMRVWVGDSLVAAAARTLHLDLPQLFLLLYLATCVTLFAAGMSLARALGLSPWATGAFLGLMTLRHRISKTGANTLEGYMHPRMLAFAIGLAALACLVRRRFALAVFLVALAAIVHPTTAGWFAIAIAMGTLSLRVPTRWFVATVACTGVAALIVLLAGPLASSVVIMDAAWESAVEGKDYLFPSEWPVYAWLANLAYPLVLWLLYRERRRLGHAADGERALVAGLLTLVAVFVVSVPLAAGRIAPIVQLQVNRVFWLLDGVVAAYLGWWLVDRLAARRGTRLRAAIVASILLIAVARGYYILAIESHRPLFAFSLPQTAWTDAMSWLRGQPDRLNVLTDPGHAWMFGASVRVAAIQDVVLESGKDSAMAMYDRDVALRVVERSESLAGFEALTTDQARELGRRYRADVLVAAAPSAFDLPVLYRNGQFTVFDLR